MSTTIEAKTLVSAFAPIHRDGPLPPGLTEHMVKAAFNQCGVGIAHVLKCVTTTGTSGTAAQRLLTELNNPKKRARLEVARSRDGSGLALHQVLYCSLRDSANGVYARLVAPAEFEKNHLTFINANTFDALVSKEVQLIAATAPAGASPTLRPDEEALAQFVLAFGLLQPDEAPALVASTLRLGPGFRDFFGAQVQQPAEVPPSLPTREAAVDLGLLPEAPPPKTAELPPDSSIHEPTATASLQDGQNREMVPPQPQLQGKYRLRIAQASQSIVEARHARQQLGAADAFESEAFAAAAQREEQLCSNLEGLRLELEREAKELRSRLRHDLRRHAVQYEVGDRPEHPQELADWLDGITPTRGRIEEGISTLDRKTALLKEGSLIPPPHAAKPAVCKTADEVLDALAAHEGRLDTLLAETRELESQFASVRLQLGDCGRPTAAKSLSTISALAARLLLRRAQVDPAQEELVPILVRLVLERDSENGEPTRAAQDLLLELLNEAAHSGDLDRHQELLSWIPRDTLRTLLLIASEELGRHILLASFRESLARNDTLFFNYLWPATGWTARTRTAGEELSAALAGIHAAFVSRGCAAQAIAAAIEESDNESRAQSRALLAQRETAAIMLRQLAEPSGMGGQHLQLKQVAFDRYFRPLKPMVLACQYRDVLAQVHSIEEKLKTGQLLTEVEARLKEKAHVRKGHQDHVVKYVRIILAELKKWCRREVTSAAPVSDSHLEEIETARDGLVRLLLHPASDVPAPSVPWLQRQMVDTVHAHRAGHPPTQSLAFFGEVPPVDTLFCSDGLRSENPQVAGRPLWPEYLAPDAGSKRLWVCSVHDDARWTDLLQDSIATLVLNLRESPPDILTSLFEAGEYEAVVEAVRRFSRFQGTGANALVDRSREHMQQRDEIDFDLNSLSGRLEILHKQQPGLHQTSGFREAEDLLLQGWDFLQRREFVPARDKAAALDARIAAVERELKKAAPEDREEINKCRSWLEKAGENVAADATLLALRQRVEAVCQQNQARRQHLVRLDALDKSGVPDDLRQAIRAIQQDLDLPSKWPSIEGATTAYDYIDLFAVISPDWWATHRALPRDDRNRKVIDKIVAVLADRLRGEIDALTASDIAGAPALSALQEPRSNIVTEYHALLVARGLSKPATAPRVPPPGDTLLTGDLLEAAIRRVEDRMAATTSGGQPSVIHVNQACDAFGRRDYASTLSSAVLAWRWAVTEKNEDLRQLMATVFAFSQEAKLDRRARIEAVGLTVASSDLLEKRARLDKETLLTWWIDRFGPPNNGGEELSARTREYILDVGKAPPGDPRREEFGTLVAVAGPLAADLFWDGLRNAKDVHEPRAALLFALFQLGEKSALEHLFQHQEDARKYLTAFVALASRLASGEPSAQLHAALHHNMRALEARLQKKGRPYLDFAALVARSLQFASGRVALTVADTLEKRDTGDTYQALVTLRPDESDPPLHLSLELLESDFSAVGGVTTKTVISPDHLVFGPQEVEFDVRPIDVHAARQLAFRAHGETTSGQIIDQTERFDVQTREDSTFQAIPIDELLHIYAGIDSRPVRGRAFVGREDELSKLEKAVANGNPGAAIIYGVRRVGKTSLLDELSLRNCVSHRPESHTLFLFVPVDTFEPKPNRAFLDVFFSLVTSSTAVDSKNKPFRQLLEKRNVTQQQLFKAADLGPDYHDVPFLAKLREYLKRVRTLAGEHVEQVVLIMDEFDKLVESYRRGLQEDVQGLVNQLRRAAMEEPDIGLVLAGSDLMKTILSWYRNALYGSACTIELGSFDKPELRAEAQEIIAPTQLHGRREFKDPVIDEVIRITGGHPFYMRMVGCASAHIAASRRVSPGTVVRAVQDLLRERVLSGDISDPCALVRNPLDALKLMKTDFQERLARLVLLQLAKSTQLDSSWTPWSRIVDDEQLAKLAPPQVWAGIRQDLFNAKLLLQSKQGYWGFRFPILGEALRVNWEYEFETEYARACAASEASI